MFKIYYKRKALLTKNLQDKKNYYKAAGIDFNVAIYITNVYLKN